MESHAQTSLGMRLHGVVHNSTFIHTHTHTHTHALPPAPLLGQPGLQLFVDTGVPVDGELVEQLVREAIQEQIGGLVRELQGGEEMVEWGASGEGRSAFLCQSFVLVCLEKLSTHVTGLLISFQLLSFFKEQSFCFFTFITNVLHLY